MKKIKDNLFIILTLLLCILLLANRLTGDICHAVLGIVLMILIAAHIGRKITKRKHKKPYIRLVDWVLMAVTAILFLTGILLHPLQGVLIIKILHKLSSVLFILGIILHMVQHRKAE